LLPGLVAAGFLGITVDRVGYDDGGRHMEAELGRALAVQPLASANSRYVFYDIRAYAAGVRRALDATRLAALRTATLDALRLEFGDSFWGEESDGSRRWHWTKGQAATIEIHNPSHSAQKAVFSALLATGSPGAKVSVSYPDGTSQRVAARAQGTPVRRTLRIPAGESSIGLSTDAGPTAPARGDPRSSLYLRVIDSELTSTVLVQGRRHRVLQPKP
jgi:hypothetical protein